MLLSCVCPQLRALGTYFGSGLIILADLAGVPFLTHQQQMQSPLCPPAALAGSSSTPGLQLILETFIPHEEGFVLSISTLLLYGLQILPLGLSPSNQGHASHPASMGETMTT